MSCMLGGERVVGLWEMNGRERKALRSWRIYDEVQGLEGVEGGFWWMLLEPRISGSHELQSCLSTRFRVFWTVARFSVNTEH